VDDPTLSLKIWVALSRARTAMERLLREDAERSGLTLAEFAVLESLHHAGPMRLSRVADRILVSSGGVTYLVDRLESRGLVERRPCERDRRSTWAALTPAGERLIASIFPGHARCIQRALSGLDREGKRSTLRGLLTIGRTARDLASQEGSARS
jgi:MarR family 2-MHQ and catechol resistance regulon transcriptional repressor